MFEDIHKLVSVSAFPGHGLQNVDFSVSLVLRDYEEACYLSPART